MNQSQLSPLEKAITKKIDKTKGKASQPGYLRKLVAKLHLRIEAALARGCEYDDLATSITESGVKISAATLKQYHTEYRRRLEKEASQPAVSILPSSELPINEEEKSAKTQTLERGSNSPKGHTNSKQSAIETLFAHK